MTKLLSSSWMIEQQAWAEELVCAPTRYQGISTICRLIRVTFEDKSDKGDMYKVVLNMHSSELIRILILILHTDHDYYSSFFTEQILYFFSASTLTYSDKITFSNYFTLSFSSTNDLD